MDKELPCKSQRDQQKTFRPAVLSRSHWIGIITDFDRTGTRVSPSRSATFSKTVNNDFYIVIVSAVWIATRARAEELLDLFFTQESIIELFSFHYFVTN